ncbi:MAG TPA: TetR/AcrR family transcriptional regulator [Chloroflexota bacterium]|nr:TetR/AcrR family transcriptional regulator [Chloroflexota bacterium]
MAQRDGTGRAGAAGAAKGRRRVPAAPSDTRPAEAPEGTARQRILDAAEALFAEHGFAATRTKAIADRAGVPNGLVFYYFPSKESLLLSLVDERSIPSRLREFLQAAPTDDPAQALTEAIVRHFAVAAQHRELARLFWREALTHPEIRRRLLSIFEEVRAPVAAYLERAVRDGRLALLDTHTAARLFTASLVLEFLLDGGENVRELAQQAAGVLLARGPAGAG